VRRLCERGADAAGGAPFAPGSVRRRCGRGADAAGGAPFASGSMRGSGGEPPRAWAHATFLFAPPAARGYLVPMPRRKSPLPVLFLTVFLDLLGFGLVIPLLPFFATHLGASGFEVGVVMTAYSAMQFLFAPLWGRLSDRIGRRPVLLVSIGASVVAMLLFAASTHLAIFALARAFAGMAAANIGTAQAYIADITPPAERARGMGMIGAAIGLGFVLGPAVGGLLAGLGLAAPAIGAAILAAINFVLAFFLLPESLPPEARARAVSLRISRLAALREALGHPILPWLFLLYFLATFGFSQMETTFALFTERRFGYGVRENGWIFAFIGVVLVLVQGGLVRPLVRALGEARLLVVSTVLLTTGLVAIGNASSLAGLLAAAALLAIGSGLHNPALSSLVSRQASIHDQGQVLGLGQSVASLARSLGPLAGGAAFELGGAAPHLELGGVAVDFAPWSTSFLVAACFLVVAVLVSVRVLVRLPRPQPAGRLICKPPA